MLKKAILILSCVILIIITVVALFYSRFEDSYELHIFIRTQNLQASLSKLKTKMICNQTNSTPKCIAEFVESSGGIKYNSDFVLILPSVFTVCNNNSDCVYETIDKLVDLISIENLDLVKHGNKSSKDFQPLLKMEIGYFDKVLRNMRKKLLDRWNSPDTNIEQKNKTLIYINNVDKKIRELQTK